MQIQENISLKRFNTFSIDAKARFFSKFNTLDQLGETLNSKFKNQKSKLVLGGGSNILFTGDYDGLVLKNEITGIDKISEGDDHVYVKAGAGENWHQFVLYCIGNNWAGIENLSLIPGCVGAAPIQNIGAYGVELKDVFFELETFHLEDKTKVSFNLNNCRFGYRDSVFKRKHKNEFVITSVTLRLNKKPAFNTDYGAIQHELERMGVKELSIKAISQAVINIRSSKLPIPEEIGNAGSFFKNPEVTYEEYLRLIKQFPLMVSFPLSNGNVKLAAGWLIEHSGPDESTSWRGYRRGDAGVHAKQALVLVNYGNTKGKEIYDLSEEILKSVKEKFGVELEREVNII